MNWFQNPTCFFVIFDFSLLFFKERCRNEFGKNRHTFCPNKKKQAATATKPTTPASPPLALSMTYTLRATPAFHTEAQNTSTLKNKPLRNNPTKEMFLSGKCRPLSDLVYPYPVYVPDFHPVKNVHSSH